MTQTPPSIRTEIKHCLTGVLECSTFHKRGALRFGASANEAMRSFLLIALFLPVNLYILHMIWLSDPVLSQTPFEIITHRYGNALIGVNIFNLMMLYAFCKTRGTLPLFVRCVSGLNWISIFPALLLIPPVLLVGIGTHTLDETRLFSLFLSIYEYSVIGFFLAHGLSVRWYAAMFLTITMYLAQNFAISLVLYP
jgi:hypothetical protein